MGQRNMDYFNTDQVASKLPYPALISALKTAFLSDLTVPKRSHFNLGDKNDSDSPLLLSMPAWRTNEYLGVKLITVIANNHTKELPTVQGTYQLFDAQNGQPIAIMDAPELTARRTAATSALASQLLSRGDSKTLLIIGTGKLAPYMAEAHANARPIERILIWGRSISKAHDTVKSIQYNGITVEVCENLEEAAGAADIISTVTTATSPIIKGKWLKDGVHLDLVGSYRPDMREVDSDAVVRSKVFVDTIEGVLSEAGDLLQPLKEGRIQEDHIVAELKGLLSNNSQGRASQDDITLFKSVGSATADYAAASLIVEK